MDRATKSIISLKFSVRHVHEPVIPIVRCPILYVWIEKFLNKIKQKCCYYLYNQFVHNKSVIPAVFCEQLMLYKWGVA